MQYERLIDNIDLLKEIKATLDAKKRVFSDGEELIMQHINAELNKLFKVVRPKMLGDEINGC